MIKIKKFIYTQLLYIKSYFICQKDVKIILRLITFIMFIKISVLNKKKYRQLKNKLNSKLFYNIKK